MYNVYLPDKPNPRKTRVVTRKSKTGTDGNTNMLRNALVGGYTKMGFKLTLMLRNKKVVKILPKRLFKLTGEYLYSLPNNDKHEDWFKTATPITIAKPEIIGKYWCNIKPGSKIVVELNPNNEIINYELYTTDLQK